MKKHILSILVIVNLLFSKASLAQEFEKTGSKVAAQPSSIVPISTVLSFVGQSIKVCRRDIKIGQVNKSCKVAYLPPVVGSVKKNIEVNFITNRVHTWIALEEQMANLCYFYSSYRSGALPAYLSTNSSRS